MRWFIPESQQSDSEEDVHALLSSFHRLRGMWSNFQPPGPIRRSDYMLLGVLAGLSAEDKATVSGLARAMRQSVPGVSQRVSTLEEQGYIARELSSRDRRSATLRLTPAGDSLLVAGSEIFLARVHRVLADFGPEKTTQLLTLLDELQQAVETATGKELKEQQREYQPEQQEDTEHTC